ncbi:hypothetical protein VSDG_03558 [Cytospora chrysosperma]|uniref:Uncharacterized protein n=1 Tax=Cytospora chrysosperma TaxID=252740 RepID=A0A423W9M7_CYTCH|nr:hypothetical protein VSDG_03558 [Valsa sordida]
MAKAGALEADALGSGATKLAESSRDLDSPLNILISIFSKMELGGKDGVKATTTRKDDALSSSSEPQGAFHP